MIERQLYGHQIFSRLKLQFWLHFAHEECFVLLTPSSRRSVSQPLGIVLRHSLSVVDMNVAVNDETILGPKSMHSSCLQKAKIILGTILGPLLREWMAEAEVE